MLMAKQTGSVIMVVAVLLVIIGGLAAGYVAMTVSTSKSSISTISANDAYDLAAAGIEQGSYQLSLGSCSVTWSAIVTETGLGEYRYNCTQYSVSSTTSAAINASVTTIPLTSVAGLASFGAITIDSEIIFYNGISGLNLLNARRGKNGTVAAIHVLGASAVQAQYVIGSEGGSPSLTSTSGKVTLNQSVFLVPNTQYFAAGTNGSSGVILNYNGTSWSTAFTALAGFTFMDIYTTATFGQAVGFNGTNGYIYQYNGASWSLLSGPIVNRRFYSIGCDSPPNATLCWIGGSSSSPTRGILYRSGTTYQASGGGSSFNMTGVSCISGVCKAVGSNHTYSYVSTGTPPMGSPVNLASTLNDVNCPQSNRCVAVRSNGSVYYHNGTSWSGAFNVSSASLNAVHCPSTGMCVLVGNTGRIYHCTLPIASAAACVLQTTPGTITLGEVYCNSTTDCLATRNTSGNIVYRYIGGAWTSITLPANYTLNGLSGRAGSGGTVNPTVLIQQ